VSIALITPPTLEPVTTADLKLQLGLSPLEDTDHIKARQLGQRLRRHIRTARRECEKRTRRVFITQTWQLQLDGWPRIGEMYAHRLAHSILLPKPPFQSLVSFTYTDTDGNLQNIIDPVLGSGQTQPGSTIATNYTAALWTCQIDPGSETQPAKLYAPFATPWPPVRLIPDNITIQFVCGYGDTGASVPDEITQAILFLAHSYYDPSAFKDVDKLVDSLLAGYINLVA
jgi:hypothetical protein